MAAKPKIFCVITGDVIDSTLLDAADRKRMNRSMQKLGEVLVQGGYRMNAQETFRGDSFQLVLKESSRVMEVALLLRAYMRGTELEGDQVLDVRLGIGLGPIEFKAKSQNASDGTAYRYAAKALDQTVKKNLANIWIKTGFEDLDENLNSINVAWETIISRWTVAQSKSMLRALQGYVHQDIANQLKVTQSTITRSLQSADEKAIQYLKAFCQRQILNYIGDPK